jgi:hypothetical protein
LLGEDGKGDKTGIVYRLRILWSVWFGGNGDNAGWGERLRIQQKLLYLIGVLVAVYAVTHAIDVIESIRKLIGF